MLFNHDGGEYLCEITSTGKSALAISVLSHDPIERESPLKIHLALSCLKREKMDFAIQKATELGAASISPLVTDFTMIKQQVLEKRWHHWQEIIYSACEQSGRNRPAKLNPITSFNDWLNRVQTKARVICEPADSLLPDIPNLKDSMARTNIQPDELSLAIGPEGGFSPSEHALAIKNNFMELNLGPRILRAETAVVAALSLMQSYWGDL